MSLTVLHSFHARIIVPKTYHPLDTSYKHLHQMINSGLIHFTIISFPFFTSLVSLKYGVMPHGLPFTICVAVTETLKHSVIESL